MLRAILALSLPPSLPWTLTISGLFHWKMAAVVTLDCSEAFDAMLFPLYFDDFRSSSVTEFQGAHCTSLGKPHLSLLEGRSQRVALERALSKGRSQKGALKRALSKGRSQKGALKRALSKGRSQKGALKRALSKGRSQMVALSFSPSLSLQL